MWFKSSSGECLQAMQKGQQTKLGMQMVHKATQKYSLPVSIPISKLNIIPIKVLTRLVEGNQSRTTTRSRDHSTAGPKIDCAISKSEPADQQQTSRPQPEFQTITMIGQGTVRIQSVLEATEPVAIKHKLPVQPAPVRCSKETEAAEEREREFIEYVKSSPIRRDRKNEILLMVVQSEEGQNKNLTSEVDLNTLVEMSDENKRIIYMNNIDASQNTNVDKMISELTPKELSDPKIAQHQKQKWTATQGCRSALVNSFRTRDNPTFSNMRENIKLAPEHQKIPIVSPTSNTSSNMLPSSNLPYARQVSISPAWNAPTMMVNVDGTSSVCGTFKLRSFRRTSVATLSPETDETNSCYLRGTYSEAPPSRVQLPCLYPLRPAPAPPRAPRPPRRRKPAPGGGAAPPPPPPAPAHRVVLAPTACAVLSPHQQHMIQAHLARTSRAPTGLHPYWGNYYKGQ